MELVIEIWNWLDGRVVEIAEYVQNVGSVIYNFLPQVAENLRDLADGSDHVKEALNEETKDKALEVGKEIARQAQRITG